MTMLMDHLNNHGYSHAEIHREPGCEYCEVGPLLSAIHDAYFNGTSEQKAAIYAIQDGYGEPGYMPSQGYDWSGVRDSTPAAIRAMHELVASWGYA